MYSLVNFYCCKAKYGFKFVKNTFVQKKIKHIGSTYSLIPPKILSKDEKLSIHILKIKQLNTYNFNFLINL